MMKKQINPLITGLAAGAVASTAAYLINHKNQSHSAAKTIRRNTGKALKTVGSMMENMSYMMK